MTEVLGFLALGMLVVAYLLLPIRPRRIWRRWRR